MEEIKRTDELIMSKIYIVRGQKVMLDKDISVLYGTETRAINQQLKRNIERFPESFAFQLTEDEIQNLRSQNVIANSPKSRVLPTVFTEHGLLMLSNVLKSETAIKMSIQIIEVFVKMREMMLTNKDILLKLEKVEKTLSLHGTNLNELYKAVKYLMDEKKKPEPAKPETKTIGFKTKSQDDESTD